jgi:hypothetical protein
MSLKPGSSVVHVALAASSGRGSERDIFYELGRLIPFTSIHVHSI